MYFLFRAGELQMRGQLQATATRKTRCTDRSPQVKRQPDKWSLSEVLVEQVWKHEWKQPRGKRLKTPQLPLLICLYFTWVCIYARVSLHWNKNKPINITALIFNISVPLIRMWRMPNKFSHTHLIFSLFPLCINVGTTMAVWLDNLFLD